MAKGERAVITAERVKQLGEYRDAVLVSVSLVYLLGYVSWALYAGTYGLGMVPLLDTQYLVAGLVPTVIVASRSSRCSCGSQSGPRARAGRR